VDGSGLALGLDIGGTKVAAALLDGAGTVLARARGPVDPAGNRPGLESVFRVADACLEAAPAPTPAPPAARAALRGIGAGCPGSIDWQAGVVRGAANLAWRDLPLGAALRDRYGVPALVENDVNAAAWGERSFGAGTEAGTGAAAGGAGAGGPGGRVDDLVFLTVGTGIGAGIVSGGRLVRGRGTAGEIGHIPLFEHGPRCACGLVGCLEALAAGPAFARAGRDLAAAGEAPGLLARAGGSAEAITPDLILRAAAGGDPSAQALLDREGYYLALAVLIAGRLLDPARIVVGGGLSEGGAVLFEALWRNLARLRPRGPDPRAFAVPPALGPDAGAVGGAALILVPEPGHRAAGLSP
jgi:glucokinase